MKQPERAPACSNDISHGRARIAAISSFEHVAANCRRDSCTNVILPRPLSLACHRLAGLAGRAGALHKATGVILKILNARTGQNVLSKAETQVYKALYEYSRDHSQTPYHAVITLNHAAFLPLRDRDFLPSVPLLEGPSGSRAAEGFTFPYFSF